MKLTQQEVVLAFVALTTDEKGPRSFPLALLSEASSALSKLKAVAVEDKIPEGEHEVDLKLEERKRLKDCLDRPWTAADGSVVLALKAKLDE